MQGVNNKFVCVPLLWADSQDGALSSDIISMKNYNQADIFIMVGDTIGKAAAVTLNKSAAVAAATVELPFTEFLSTGFVLEYDGASNAVIESAGAAFTGAGGGAGVVYKDLGNKLIAYGYNGTTFVDDETITFTTSGRTAVANGIQKNEDILVPRSTASATTYTFDLAAVASKMYCIPVSADMLGEDYDCLQLEIADADSTKLASWVVLSEPRYIGEIPETAIYD
jgi:hypothetical protein